MASIGKLVTIDPAQTLDFVDALSPMCSAEEAEHDAVVQYYREGRGLRIAYDNDVYQGASEMVGFRDDIVMVFNRGQDQQDSVSQCKVGDGDWIHVQFVIKGQARESAVDGQFIELPEHSCTILRQPEDVVVSMETSAQVERWGACLLMRPKVMSNLFGMDVASLFPDHLRWLADDGDWGFQHEKMLLSPLAAAAINDMFNCPFSNQARYAYMNAKTMELISIVANSLIEATGESESELHLTEFEERAIRNACRIMNEDLGKPLTLHDLASRVGINRSKLASGFKRLYNETLQSYWRDLRLVNARELLLNQHLPVTEVAARVGYAQISCFTRAFTKRFGMAPKDLRGGGSGRG